MLDALIIPSGIGLLKITLMETFLLNAGHAIFSRQETIPMIEDGSQLRNLKSSEPMKSDLMTLSGTGEAV